MPTYKDIRGRWRYKGSVAGRRYSGSTPIGDNTQRRAAQLERDHIDRVSSGVVRSPVMNDWLDEFMRLKTGAVEQLTHRTLKTHEVHLRKAFGTLRIDHIDQRAIEEAVATWRTTAAQSTINTRLGTLRQVLAMAVRHKRLAEVPPIRKGKVPKTTPWFLSDEECRALLSHAKPKWHAMMLVAIRTGLRIGELRGLRWSDVDLARGVIRVRRTDPGVHGMDANEPKGKTHRTVPLTGDASDVLAAYMAPEHRHGLVWPSYGSRGHGRSRSVQACYRAILKAAEAAKLVDVGWHTLRHTFASHLVMRGVPIRVVQVLLGHASVTMTEVYAHLAPDFDFAGAVALLETPILQRPQLTDGENT